MYCQCHIQNPTAEHQEPVEPCIGCMAQVKQKSNLLSTLIFTTSSSAEQCKTAESLSFLKRSRSSRGRSSL